MYSIDILLKNGKVINADVTEIEWHERSRTIKLINNEVVIARINIDNVIGWIDSPKRHARKFEEIVVEYPPDDLCAYPEYKGKPYFSIKYEENGEHIIGFGTYNPEVLSRYLREYFIIPTTVESDKEESNEDSD